MPRLCIPLPWNPPSTSASSDGSIHAWFSAYVAHFRFFLRIHQALREWSIVSDYPSHPATAGFLREVLTGFGVGSAVRHVHGLLECWNPLWSCSSREVGAARASLRSSSRVDCRGLRRFGSTWPPPSRPACRVSMRSLTRLRSASAPVVRERSRRRTALGRQHVHGRYAALGAVGDRNPGTSLCLKAPVIRGLHRGLHATRIGDLDVTNGPLG
jgi:hypothetical protein